jgi:hypothetical protein
MPGVCGENETPLSVEFSREQWIAV